MGLQNFILSFDFEDKPMSRVGLASSLINMAVEMQKGSGPAGLLIIFHHGAGPPAHRLSSAPGPLLPPSVGPLLLLSPLPGIRLWAQVTHPSVSTHHLLRKPDQVRFSVLNVMFICISPFFSCCDFTFISH